jgi:hypothetical protein
MEQPKESNVICKLYCMECEKQLETTCYACDYVFKEDDPIYCWDNKHFCSECGQICNCKMK